MSSFSLTSSSQRCKKPPPKYTGLAYTRVSTWACPAELLHLRISSCDSVFNVGETGGAKVSHSYCCTVHSRSKLSKKYIAGVNYTGTEFEGELRYCGGTTQTQSSCTLQESSSSRVRERSRSYRHVTAVRSSGRPARNGHKDSCGHCCCAKSPRSCLSGSQ